MCVISNDFFHSIIPFIFNLFVFLCCPCRKGNLLSPLLIFICMQTATLGQKLCLPVTFLLENYCNQ